MELTSEQIRMLKTELARRYYALRKEIRQELLASDQAPYIELAGRVHDTGEASVADLLEDVELADVNRHIDELRAIDAALLRIAHGTYGICIDCEGPIGFERLKAQPTALRCHPCQVKWEARSAPEPPRGPSL